MYRAFPALQRLVRGAVYAMRETAVLGFVKRPRLMRSPRRSRSATCASRSATPELLEKVTPDYTIGCKRILPSNRWYPALGKPNVELVTDGITEVREHSIVTADGTEREVDTIIFSTGFHVTDMPVGKKVRGRGGRTLDEVSGRAARGRTSAARCPASRTCSCCSARTPGSGTTRWST